MSKSVESGRYDLEILGFPGQSVAEAATNLARAFDIPIETAVEYVRSAPVVVVQDADDEALRIYGPALHEIGADLRVVSLTSSDEWEALAFVDSDESTEPSEADAEPQGPAVVGLEPDVPLPTQGPSETEAPPPSGLRDAKFGRAQSVECPHCGKLQFGSYVCQNCGRSYFRSGGHAHGLLPTMTGEHLAAAADEQEGHGADTEKGGRGLRTYVPPDLDAARQAWVDRMSTGEFFLHGRRNRPISSSEFAKLHPGSAAKRAQKRKRRGRKRSGPDAKSRERIALVLLAITAVVGGGLLLIRAIHLPTILQHETARGEYTVRVPSGYQVLSVQSGQISTRIGELEYTTHVARRRDDPLGAFGFSVLALPRSVRENWPESRILSDALRATAAGYNGRIGSKTEIEEAVHPGMEGRYTATRYGRDFVGRVRAFENEEDLVILHCEGQGESCFSDGRSEDFFASYAFQAN